MKKIIPFLTLAFCSVFLTNCENKEPVRCELLATSTKSNSPVFSGDQILLTTPEYTKASDVIYQWTGPNGFVSNLQNPIINNATAAMSGDYKLVVKKGICETLEISTPVVIINNTVNCVQSNNTADFSGANFYYFESVNVANNEHQFIAANYEWDVFANFIGDTKPVTGIYTIVSAGTALTANTVHLKSKYKSVFGGSINYVAKSGDLSITYIDGFFVMKFCSVPFSLTTSTSTDFTGSGKFTQQ